MNASTRQQPRQLADFYYDAVALATLLGLLATGLILWPLLGFGPGVPKYFWTLHRQQWIDLHLAFALVFVLICLIHIVCHWRWVKLMAPRHLSLQLGLKGLLALLAATLLTVTAVGGGYMLLEKSRLAPESQQRTREPGRSWSQVSQVESTPGENVVNTPDEEQFRRQDRSPRSRGGL